MTRQIVRLLFPAILSLLSGCGDELFDPAPSIEQIQAEIFTPSCATTGCHAGPNPAQMLDLRAPAADDLLNVESTEVSKLLVEPGNLANSYLYDKVTGQMLASGTSPMPLSGPLPAAQIDLIRRWIEGGAF